MSNEKIGFKTESFVSREDWFALSQILLEKIPNNGRTTFMYSFLDNRIKASSFFKGGMPDERRKSITMDYQRMLLIIILGDASVEYKMVADDAIKDYEELANFINNYHPKSN